MPQSIEVFIIYLQSIGGLELVDNHSSHQESNEAGPLALNLPLDECIVNTFTFNLKKNKDKRKA